MKKYLVALIPLLLWACMALTQAIARTTVVMFTPVPESNPYEDFTTFTESDADNVITIDSATQISWDDMVTRRPGDEMVYYDYGADHFSGDFSHQFEMTCSNVGNITYLAYWMMSSYVGTITEHGNDSQDGYYLAINDDATDVWLTILDDGASSTDTWDNGISCDGTIYYITVARDDDGGANGTGQVTAEIHTGDYHPNGVHQDLLTRDCGVGEQNDYRYVYAVNGFQDDCFDGTTDGSTRNLNINE